MWDIKKKTYITTYVATALVRYCSCSPPALRLRTVPHDCWLVSSWSSVCREQWLAVASSLFCPSTHWSTRLFVCVGGGSCLRLSVSRWEAKPATGQVISVDTDIIVRIPSEPGKAATIPEGAKMRRCYTRYFVPHFLLVILVGLWFLKGEAEVVTATPVQLFRVSLNYRG